MKWKLEWAPLEFALVTAASNVGTGIVLLRYANNPTDERAPRN
jgi:hypothetical protein